MSYRATERCNAGAHGDIYRGVDSLGRPVAIKFIRQSVGGGVDFVREQALALVRVKSPHVISVISMEDVVDPESEKAAPAIIMEWVDGQTLEDLLQGPRLSLAEVRRIGNSLITGVSAIHAAEIAHSDLHARNVLISADLVKIIDILYYNTLAELSTASRDFKYRSDRNHLRFMLAGLLMHSETSAAQVNSFNQSVRPESSIEDIQVAFERATYESATLNVDELVQAKLKKLCEKSFVDSNEYAELLADETHDAAVRPIIEAMIEKGAAESRHARYLARVWDRLSEPDRAHIGVTLGEAIDREVPDGNFRPNFEMLSAFGVAGWKSLPRLTAIRLEHALLESMSSGRHEAYGGLRSGGLGTFIGRYCRYFADPTKVLKIASTSLRGGWGSQNYVGNHFFRLLPRLVQSDAEKEDILSSITIARRDNAFGVNANFRFLPEDWQTEVNARIEAHRLRQEELEKMEGGESS